ncbi:MAG: aromatic ring-hydroxylating dioxygenase subunit alpha [Alphaproteobacteria bacterium]|nr:aromatic ring-hydroxylating dioxygenase subunit alpha [Alphaproteobacteria bacterium]
MRFPRNGWYTAIWSKELADQPIARTILGEKLVLFRGANGRAGALADRCCHRAAPLSLGQVAGDRLRCGYHGLEFDTDGRCVAIPGQADVPAGAQVRAYPAVERWNAVWVWMGDPALADPGKIVELPWLDSKEWTATPSYLHLQVNAQLLIDNLLDYTHVSYLHAATIAGDPREATTPTKTERINDGVRVGRWMIDFKPPPLFAKAGGFTGNVDRWQHATWKSPSTVYMDVGAAKTGTGAPEGDRSQGISIWSTHLVTPETDASCHYHFGFARNFALDDAEMSQLLFNGARNTFLEDKAMLEAQQHNLEAGDLDGLMHIGADAAQLQARRMLADLVRAEAD